VIRSIGISALVFPALLAAQPNAVLLVAKPGMADPNFRETVVLVTQTPDASTVGVILNRPTSRTHEATGEPVYEGGPVMREVLVAVFRAEREPTAAFHVLPGVYLSMHPDNIGAPAPERRIYAGFAGWVPGQLQKELARDAWYVLPASMDVIFRNDTGGLWRELVDKATNRVAMRREEMPRILGAVANEIARGILVP
jgi:putative transcriptional regulator